MMQRLEEDEKETGRSRGNTAGSQKETRRTDIVGWIVAE
jgi:hypothetical protein